MQNDISDLTRGDFMLIANTFMALAVVTVIEISGLIFLYIENHKPVYYVGEQKSTQVGATTCVQGK